MFHVKCFMEIIGNRKTIKLLDRIVASGKVANAYLFLGPENVGKFMLAKEFAAKLSSDPSENLGRINSNLIIIEPEIEVVKSVTKKLDIKVETIRELQHKLSLTAYGIGYKAVIINDAERLNKTAQNALLKTLEEPNARVVLILVSKDEKRLLPTILSRCQKIKFGLVGRQEMQVLVASDAKQKEIIFWSAGRPGIAKKLLDDPLELEYREKTARELADIFSKNTSERFSLAETWSKDDQEISKKLDLWQVILRQSMLGENYGISVSSDKALCLLEEISESMQILKDTNTNTRLVLENLFLKFL